MRKILIAALLCRLSGMAMPVSDEFDDFLTASVKEFDSFISEANRSYINFLRNPWKEYECKEAENMRPVPDPVTAPVFSESRDTTSLNMDVRDILDFTVGEDKVENPEDDVVAPAFTGKVQEAVEGSVSALYTGGQGRTPVRFAGRTYYLDSRISSVFSLRSIDEKAVASAFEALYSSDYKPLIDELRILRRDDLGNDWALYLVIKDFASRLVGLNESMVLRQFLLNMLGFRARVAIAGGDDDRLSLLVAPDVKLYGCIFIVDGGTNFYDVDCATICPLRVCPVEAPDARKRIGMHMASLPALGGTVRECVRTSEVSGVTVRVPVSEDLAEFYSRIPQCDFSVYATSVPDTAFGDALVGTMKAAVQGKSETDAAALLLDFCQNAFRYLEDHEQFGFEKPFFIEELFYYPACDCEDRSMLFRYLVKRVLGLDVVLLDYPGHIATAVRFNGDVAGDHVMVDGERYTVCDPTNIGAPVGVAMRQFRSVPAEVLRY